MLDLAVAADLAVRSTRRIAGSALPDAPVLPTRPERVRPSTRVRARVASRLHRVAAALEPQREPASSGRMGATPACR
jgi:hypothetical protein